MPLAVPENGAPLSAYIVFGKDRYAPGEPIDMQMVIEGATPPVNVTFTGTYQIGIDFGTAVGTVAVGPDVSYGPVSAPGYDVVQDTEDPSRYLATPVADPVA